MALGIGEAPRVGGGDNADFRVFASKAGTQTAFSVAAIKPPQQQPQASPENDRRGRDANRRPARQPTITSARPATHVFEEQLGHGVLDGVVAQRPH